MFDRLRNCCPKCGSVQIDKMIREGGYACVKCGWTGDTPKEMMWNNETAHSRCGRRPRVRNRSCCPKCDSLVLYRYSKTRNYKCKSCGWTGSNPNKIEFGGVSWKKEKLAELKETKSVDLLSLKFQEKGMLVQNVVV